jgi:hypothetical protein
MELTKVFVSAENPAQVTPLHGIAHDAIAGAH